MSGDRVFFIAEAGVNHNGTLDMAIELIDAAARAGADAVKFQTAIPEEVVRASAAKAPYQKATTGGDGSQLEMVRDLHFRNDRLDVHRRLAQLAAERSIAFLSTPFDLPSLHMLVHEIGLRTLKISSGDVTNGPLLLAAAQADCDVVLSTGMAMLVEVEAALGVLAFGYLNSGNPKSLEMCRAAYESADGQDSVRRRVTLLQCVTAYPAPTEQANLRAMDTLAREFKTRVGFSDHSLGSTIAIAAAARGAAVIEKHFTLDRSLPGPDHAASLEPSELAELIATIRQIEKALGSGIKDPQACELENMSIARRGLVAKRAIKRGEVFSADNVTAKRPETGMSPMQFWDLMGQHSSADFEIDETIRGQ
jgi:N-acetylneuraminate synthase